MKKNLYTSIRLKQIPLEIFGFKGKRFNKIQGNFLFDRPVCVEEKKT